MKARNVSLFSSVCIILLTAFMVSIQENGPDLAAYNAMISYIQSGDSFFSKISLSKDPLFGLIVTVINPIQEDEYKKVFIVVAIIGVGLKISLLKEIKPAFTFSSLYFILFSPSLDFSAIRAFTGLFFVLLFLTSKFNESDENLKKTYLFCLLSILSHVSMLLPVVLSSKTVLNEISKRKALYCTMVFIFVLTASPLLSLFENTQTYINSGGTVFALIPPLLTAISLVLYGGSVNFSNDVSRFTYNISLIIAVVSIAFAPSVIIASGRFLQVSQFLFLFVLCSYSVHIKRERIYHIIYIISLAMYVVPLVYRNVSLELWEMVLSNFL